jgi:hypothetical protein
MRELIRHILKESRVQQELKQVIKDSDIFNAADLVGGISTLKRIFKDDPEMSSLFEKLKGTIIFYYPVIAYEDIEFPLDYEIIGRHSNIVKTNHWPEINVLYDENKLTPEENKDFKSMIKYLYDDAQHSAFKSKFEDSRMFNTNYFTVKEINGEDIDLIDSGSFSLSEVEELHDKFYGGNQSLNESEKDTKKLFRVIKMIMEDMILPEYGHIICSYNITSNEDFFNIPQVTVLFIGGYGSEYWPVTQAVRNMYNEVLDNITNEIATYTGVVIYVDMLQTPKCNDKENIYLRESKSKNKYSPAGKEIIPNEKVFHQSNPIYRNKIEEQGLKVRAGECYTIYSGRDEKCIPAIFATNSSNKRDWFDSSYDDDVWEIDTTKIPNVKWYKDRHFEGGDYEHHIVTFKNIPRDAIKLIYEGSGEDSGLMESESKSVKEKSLIKIIEKEGLYDFIEMTGLDFNKVRSLLRHVENPKEILKQYIREFVLEHDGSGGSNYGSLFALNLPLSDTKYVNDILVQDSGQSAVEIWEYHLDEYGHREQKDQYLTSIITLTTEELLSILSWMMEVIEGGYWD